MAQPSDFFILVVDDEVEIAEILSESLTYEDFKSGFNTSPIEALEFIKSNSVDVVLCDANMPQMKGIELLAELRKNNIPAKFYLCTGDVDFEENQIKELGGDGLLLKPFSVSDIVTRLKADLGLA